MKLHYYEETDTLHIDLNGRRGSDVREVSPGVTLNMDENGEPVGIDIDEASLRLDLCTFKVAALPPAAQAQPDAAVGTARRGPRGG